MGKVKAAVKKHIRNGDVIACDVEADFAVIAGEYLCAKESPTEDLKPVFTVSTRIPR